LALVVTYATKITYLACSWAEKSYFARQNAVLEHLEHTKENLSFYDKLLTCENVRDGFVSA
jgi:hypothetical protein